MAAKDQHMQDLPPAVAAAEAAPVPSTADADTSIRCLKATVGTIIAKTGNGAMPMIQQSVLVSVNTFLKATIAALAMQPLAGHTILRQLLTSDEPPVRDVITATGDWQSVTTDGNIVGKEVPTPFLINIVQAIDSDEEVQRIVGKLPLVPSTTAAGGAAPPPPLPLLPLLPVPPLRPLLLPTPLMVVVVLRWPSGLLQPAATRGNKPHC
jgi:hypothetical protein